MIVAVIRHAKVDMKWKFMMTSAGYDKGCADYDTADVLPVTVRLPETEFERIYDLRQRASENDGDRQAGVCGQRIRIDGADQRSAGAGWI